MPIQLVPLGRNCSYLRTTELERPRRLDGAPILQLRKIIVEGLDNSASEMKEMPLTTTSTSVC
jgi:hypothetical protein